MEKRSGKWERFLTVAGIRDSSNISSSGRNMAANTTPRSPPKFLHLTLWWTSITDTQKLLDISTGLSLIQFFHPGPIALRCSNLEERVNVRRLH